jgi:hypothetical protein
VVRDLLWQNLAKFTPGLRKIDRLLDRGRLDFRGNFEDRQKKGASSSPHIPT